MPVGLFLERQAVSISIRGIECHKIRHAEITMNIFELSAIATPLVGAIAGGSAAKASGIGWLTVGIVLGLAIGIAMYFLAIGLSCLLGRFCTAEKLNPLQWLASLTAVLLPAAAPFAAYALSVFVVSGVIHL